MIDSLKTARTISLCALLLVLAGCSDSDDPAPTSTDQTSSPAPDSGESPTVLTKYDGTYLDSCAAIDSEFPAEGYEIATTTIAGDTASSRVLKYTDSACTSPNIPAEEVLEFSLVYPGGTVETALGTADFVDVTPESRTLDGQLDTNVAFQTFYDILLLDGISLYSGDDSGDLDGDTAVTRPDTLASVPSIRQ